MSFYPKYIYFPLRQVLGSLWVFFLGGRGVLCVFISSRLYRKNVLMVSIMPTTRAVLGLFGKRAVDSYCTDKLCIRTPFYNEPCSH